MKRGIVVVIVVVAIGAVLLFAFPGRVDAPPAQETATVPPAAKSKPDTFEESVAAIKADTMAKYGADIEWLTSSSKEYEQERQLLREYFAKEFDKAEAITKQKVILQIAKVDLNGDGRQDLVWRILNPFYHTVSTSGTLAVSWYDENGELHHQLYFPVTWVPIAVRSSDKSAWKDLIVENRLYRWNGKRYDLIVVPVETLADEKHFTVTKDIDDRYTVRIFGDNKGQIYFDRPLARPTVTMYDGNIVRIRKTYLYGNTSSEYYDIAAKKHSDYYDEVVTEKGNKIVQIIRDKLIIRNMFDDKVYYKEVVRDFTRLVPHRRNAILQVEWDKPDAILVHYLAGPERRIVTEEIILD